MALDGPKKTDVSMIPIGLSPISYIPTALDRPKNLTMILVGPSLIYNVHTALDGLSLKSNVPVVIDRSTLIYDVCIVLH